MHMNCVISGPKSKNSDFENEVRWVFFQKLKAILQHATAEKRAGDGMFFQI